jgi:hypothetical protein
VFPSGSLMKSARQWKKRELLGRHLQAQVFELTPAPLVVVKADAEGEVVQRRCLRPNVDAAIAGVGL